MIDHTQFEIFCTPEECQRLLADGEFCWRERTTRQGRTWYEGSLLNLNLQLYPLSGTLNVAGSLHAYANDGQHNADDFTRLRLFDTIDHLSGRLGIDPARAELRGLEFGVNVQPPRPTGEVLNRILTYGKAVPVRFEAEGSDGRRLKYGQRQLKVYDKARQFRRPGPLLRVEIHVDKMEWVRSQVPDLRTLNDLRRADVLARLGESQGMGGRVAGRTFRRFYNEHPRPGKMGAVEQGRGMDEPQP